MKVLLVEDEARIAQALCELLRQEGYDTDWFDDGLSGADALESGVYDLAVMDIMLPYKNGFEITRDARKAGIRIPVLMLTAKTDVDDKVEGLDCGADDYLTKPFVPKELLARLRALSRRQYDIEDGSVKFGDIKLSSRTMMLSCLTTGNEIRLSDKEFKALEYLMVNSKQILTREQLAVKIWGYDSDAEYNNVEVYMTFVRKKLAFIGTSVSIRSVRGVGYQIKE